MRYICSPTALIGVDGAGAFGYRTKTNFYGARVAELVDAPDSKSGSFGSAGSIPASGTKKTSTKMILAYS